MIDTIVEHTSQLKMLLIELGFELTPPVQFQKNKIKQINREFQDIARILYGTCDHHLFDNVRHVSGSITAQYRDVMSLQDVLVQTQRTNRYIRQYLQ